MQEKYYWHQSMLIDVIIIQLWSFMGDTYVMILTSKYEHVFWSISASYILPQVNSCFIT
jgi:hypothetical protein